ncbi:translocation protein [Cladochytrium replicatum]|nr:translocation protein [Cladochytrium replicatum]
MLQLPQIPREHINAADYLRSGDSKMKNRQGVLNGKRVDFFKGKSAVNALLRQNYKATAKRSRPRPPVTDRPSAEKLLSTLLSDGLFVRVDKPPKSKHLTLTQHHPHHQPPFAADAYYAWAYEGSEWSMYLLGLALVALTLAGVMFPLWPMPMKTGVWYLSLGVLGIMGLFMILVVVRLFIWIGTLIVLGQGGWLYPNLFADVGIIESFIPLWGWDPKKGEKRSRSAGVKAKSSGSDGEGLVNGAADGDDDDE